MSTHPQTISGFSGLFDTIEATGLTIYGTRNVERHITRMFKHRGLASQKELMLTLLGTAAGSTANASRTRLQYTDVVPGEPVVLGGVRPIEAESQVNRVTTADDIADLNALLTNAFTGALVADLSGNGGGGKVGSIG